jgi:hypothetical protein
MSIGVIVKKRVRRPASVLAAVLSVGVLAACGPMEPGAAAIVGDTRITQQSLAAQVSDILAAQGQPIDTADAQLTSTILGRMVTAELVDQAADQAGIAISQGDIDTALMDYDAQAGGRAEVEKIFLEQNIAPSQIQGIVVLNLQAQALGRVLLPNGDSQAQGSALVQQLALFSNAIGTTVSPRYGSWDPAALSIGPLTDPLSVPAPDSGA